MCLGRRARRLALWALLSIGAAGLVAAAAWRASDAPATLAVPGSPAAGAGYIVQAWNDLGMHCYNPDFQDLAILPPYNTIWAQVIAVGDPPRIVTGGVTVEYSFPGNTSSVAKTNFWTYALPLFGVSLPPNVGLKGKGLAGTMDRQADHFVAEGIPLTEFLDADVTLANPLPYQLAAVVARDAATGVILAQNQVVAPVSSELRCDNCHADDGDATTRYPIAPTGKVETNILTLHDYLSGAQYPAGHMAPLMARRPVLCAECHSSNALGVGGVSGLSSLSNAMHNHHKSLPDITPDTSGCYNCHPGPLTQCLRDVMSQRYGFNCTDCHGLMDQVANNPQPWLNEPRCDNASCHGQAVAKQNQPLYRFSSAHGGVYCEACHDSTHAIAPSRESNDGIKFANLQGPGQRGPLAECLVCHASAPSDRFAHRLPRFDVFLPMLGR